MVTEETKRPTLIRIIPITIRCIIKASQFDKENRYKPKFCLTAAETVMIL